MAAPEAQAVLFDLDETLYPRRRFVLSGFAAVARHLALTRGLDRRTVCAVLRQAWGDDRRGLELQACVERFHLPPASVADLVAIMRGHRPALRLPRSSARTLRGLRADWRLAVVTNGQPDVQARKIDALGLGGLVDTVVFASQHGSGLGKPDRAPFAVALARLGVAADRAVFVGDDETCDIVGAANAGMRTILVRRNVDGPAEAGPHRRGDDGPAEAGPYIRGDDGGPAEGGTHVRRRSPMSVGSGFSRTLGTRADAVVETLADVPRVAATLMNRSRSHHVA